MKPLLTLLLLSVSTMSFADPLSLLAISSTASDFLTPKPDRKAWLKSQTELLRQNDEELNELFYSKNEILGLEVLFAGPMDSAPESKWGHALLRFVGDPNDPLSDKVVSLVANVDEPQISYTKGVLGGYKVLPYVKGLGDFIMDYVETQERPIYRYVVPSNQEMREKVLAILKEWARNPNEPGRYRFISNNCVGLLAKLFVEAGMLDPHTRCVRPNRVSNCLNESFMSPYPSLMIPTLSSTFDWIAKVLNVRAESLKRGIWPLDSSYWISKIPLNTLRRIYFQAPPKDGGLRYVMKTLVMAQTNRPSLNDVYGVKSIPNSVYQLCSTYACAGEWFQGAKNVWNQKEITLSMERITDGTQTDLSQGFSQFSQISDHLHVLATTYHFQEKFSSWNAPLLDKGQSYSRVR